MNDEATHSRYFVGKKSPKGDGLSSRINQGLMAHLAKCYCYYLMIKIAPFVSITDVG